jgi:SAM-dependent MidA family methyltransferase
MQLVAVWLLSQWMNSGHASGFRLVELGPGRGTLMEDVLRVGQDTLYRVSFLKSLVAGYLPVSLNTIFSASGPFGGN